MSWTEPSTENTNPPFKIPERAHLLLGTSRLQAMREAAIRHASTVSRASNFPLKPTASEFLDIKIDQLLEYKSCAETVKAGIIEAHDEHRVPPAEFTEFIRPILGRLSAASETLKVLKGQKNAITDDLIEEVVLSQPSDVSLLERAYSDSIISRVMNASAKQSATAFDHDKFKKTVRTYYGILSQRPSSDYSWCHVLGDWIPSGLSKAAHIVPKSLHATEVAHIFGDSDAVLSESNAQNALSLHKNIEELMDQGTIVIVPASVQFLAPTQWRCLVLDHSVDKNMVCYLSKDNIIKVQDLHGKILTFLNDNRPRCRYLYFRFVLSYLNAKRRGRGQVTALMEKMNFWPSGGSYLHQSTLQALARFVSGSSIPKKITETQTFGDAELRPEDSDASDTLAAGILEPHRERIRQCIIESSGIETPETTSASDTSQDWESEFCLSPRSPFTPATTAG